MTDIDALIEAVEAGAEWISVLAAKVFPPQQAVDACKAYGHEGQPGTKGSLDAARSLHDALLPGWVWQVGDKETGLAYATVYPQHDFLNQSVGYAMDPARAWLLAQLRAIKPQS